MTLDVASSITLQTLRVSSEYGHFYMNLKMPQIGPKVSGAIRQGKSDNRFPHVKMGEILANG